MANCYIIAKREKYAEPFLKAFKEAGFNSEFCKLSELSLISKPHNTEIDPSFLEKADAVFINLGAELFPFVEPLLDELYRRGIYSHMKPNAVYFNYNEALQLINLAQHGIPVPNATIVADKEMLNESNTKDLCFPLLVKSFSQGKKIQTAIIETKEEFVSFVSGIKLNPDLIIAREFTPKNLKEIAVIGEQFFCIERRIKGKQLEPIENGQVVKLSAEEKELAIKALEASNLEIGTVKIVEGKVTGVKVELKYDVFSSAFGEDMRRNVAQFYLERVKR
ncbi:MAG: hypothetical protein J7L14_01365 [Candidatus Diapherotrites archaeon]|nr:hypothetical protein [Candidatus Diapherotrites archaeon]